MEAKQKAIQLVDKFFKMGDVFPVTTYAHAKQCAIIAVDEILRELPDKTTFEHGRIGYWKEVKSEIEKL